MSVVVQKYGGSSVADVAKLQKVASRVMRTRFCATMRKPAFSIIALIAGRFMERLLFGVKATDPVVYVGVMLTLIAAAAIATLIPAWRATVVSPTTALRSE